MEVIIFCETATFSPDYNYYLFDSSNCYRIVQFPLRTRLLQVVINFSRTEENSLDFIGVLGRDTLLRDNPQELGAFQHEIEARASLRMT